MSEPDLSPAAEITRWFTEQLPADWFDGPPKVIADRDEVLVLGTLAHPSTTPDPTGTGDAAHAPGDGADALAEQTHITRFREQTREQRIHIAARAEALFARKVSWGAHCGDTRVLFTHLSIPVMTRLRIDERHILDTLVAAGVARSRSDALGWCVRLVAEHEGDWIDELRDALTAVEQVRARRPG